MSLQLLEQLQTFGDRYALERLAHDAAHAKGDLAGTIRHMEHLREMEAEFPALYQPFSRQYEGRKFKIENGMTVVWRAGSVGLQGVVTNASYVHAGSDVIVKVATKRGVNCEFARNLMPLAEVHG